MNELKRSEIIASSSIWVSSLLNIIPGLGTGYLYQRRWKAYWTTSLIYFLLLIVGFARESQIDQSDPLTGQSDMFILYGLIFILIFTSIESALSVKKARESLKE
tara:strand:+ start:379 stop:690 length:312 start_codon:yes stop_codon:yes gene_type:complete